MPSLQEIVQLSHRAGACIMAVYAEASVGTIYKADDSPLTRADLASHDLIVATLGAATPDLPVLSEESREVSCETRRAWRRFWLVDPLDGTKEFIKKSADFTVNIAQIDDGRPVLGVVFAPALGVTYYGAVGQGAFKQVDGVAHPIRVAKSAGAPLKVVASMSHGSEALEAFLSRLGPIERVSRGSSLKCCLVAEGAADLYPRLGPTMEWDTAAGQCVVEAAGGRVTDMDGHPLRYNKPNLLNPWFVVDGSAGFPWMKYK